MAGEKTSFTLTTIRVSHYCEKARWVLDRFRVAYDERACLPILHMPVVLKATRGIGRADAASSSLSTPVLLTDTGTLLHDSQDILYYINARYATPATSLYPAGVRECEQVRELEAKYHRVLGPITRRIAYFYGLESPEVLFKLASMNVSTAQSVAFRSAFSFVKNSLVSKLGISATRTRKDEERLFAMLDEAEQQLESRRYLVGDRFTAADLTLACMLAPVMLVQPEEGYAARLASLNEVGTGFRRLASSVRAHAVGQHALRMFQEERGVRVVACTQGDLGVQTWDADEVTEVVHARL